MTSTSSIPSLLTNLARQAVNEAQLEFRDKPKVVDPNSNADTSNLLSIDIAKRFLSQASPDFLSCPYAEDDDRLVKVGRSVVDILDLQDDDDDPPSCPDPLHEEKESESHIIDSSSVVEGSLSHVVEQCQILATAENLRVPTVRFGKTEIQMPIVTLGCMRFQQTWGGKVNDMDKVAKDGQANLVSILRHAITNLGINHIETARGYGSSEIQIGDALKTLFDEKVVQREDLILQTKVNAMEPNAFRATLEKSFALLQVDYIDLFSFHGLNMEWGYDLVFQNESGENLIDIVKEYQAKGKIKHVGFSTHGQPEFIRKCVETGAFQFANVHYHAFGSYTASGGGKYGGNEEIVRLMNEKDMGVFIISPYDKAGMLYAPSRKLRSLTLPDLDPMKFHSLFLFNHDELSQDVHDASLSSSSTETVGNGAIHTQTIGAARPSDLDEPAIAAYLYAQRKEEMLGKVRAIHQRLRNAEVEALGEEWVKSWHVGVPNALTSDDAYQFGQMVGLYNVIHAWGMLEFARERYGTFDGNLKKWDWNEPVSENIAKNRVGWGYMPGVALEEGKDYSEYLQNVPEENKERVQEAIWFVHKYCSKSSDRSTLTIPKEWETAYDARSWVAYPERS